MEGVALLPCENQNKVLVSAVTCKLMYYLRLFGVPTNLMYLFYGTAGQIFTQHPSDESENNAFMHCLTFSRSSRSWLFLLNTSFTFAHKTQKRKN